MHMPRAGALIIDIKSYFFLQSLANPPLIYIYIILLGGVLDMAVGGVSSVSI